MKSFVTLVYGLAIFQVLVASTSMPKYFETYHITRRTLKSPQVQRELGSQVSNTTVIFGPGDSSYDAATARWNMFAPPQIEVVIEPGQESDIPTIVRSTIIVMKVLSADCIARSNTAMKTTSDSWP